MIEKFGVEKITEDQRQVYFNIKKGDDTSWGVDGITMVNQVDKCISTGGEFHVSSLKSIHFVFRNVLQKK